MPLINLHLSDAVMEDLASVEKAYGLPNRNELFERLIEDAHWELYLRPIVRQSLLDIRRELGENKFEHVAQTP